jgi:predicted GNAT family acetyltransferase
MAVENSVDVADEPDESRFTARIDGALAGSAYYQRRGDRVIFTHTEVDDAYEGHGVGSALARAALETVRQRGERAVPLCPFIAHYITRHPEYDDLVDHELLDRLKT